MNEIEVNEVLPRTEELAAFAGIFTSPIRLAILESLLNGPRIVGDLCASLGQAQAVISKQLGLLRDCGILRCQPDGRCREYSLTDPKTTGKILSLMRIAASRASESCGDSEGLSSEPS